MVVCHCYKVRGEDLRSEVRLGAHSLELVVERCRASSRCGGCLPAVAAIVLDEAARAEHAVAVRN